MLSTNPHNRTILLNIWEYIDTRDILLLNGARQVGKTTLLHMIKERLVDEKHVPETHIHWFDLERVDDLSIWSNQTTALALLPLKDSAPHYIFIDEFQKSKTIGSILKVLHDHYPQFKLIVTGSASWYLTIDESMAGRKRVFPVYPLSFEEFILWQDDIRLRDYYALATRAEEAATPEIIASVNNAFVEFTRYGGYPAVALAQTLEEKTAVLQEIINSYLIRDIQLANYAANSLQIKKLLTLLASQVGSLLDINNLALNAGLGRSAVLNRLELLQNTFILHLVRPYFTNKIKELVKNPKVYLVDTGLRHAILQNFTLTPQTVDFGYAAENCVMTECEKRKGAMDALYFWRTKTGQEVDIVVKREGALTPIEVKSGDTTSVPSAMRAFIRAYHPTQAYMLNWSVVKTIAFDDCTVHFRPLWFPVV